MSYTFRGIVLPDELKESIDAYVETGRPTGSFLQAVIDNNLREAINRADEESMNALQAIVGYFYNETPSACWGNPGKHWAWVTLKRKERIDHNAHIGATEKS